MSSIIGYDNNTPINFSLYNQPVSSPPGLPQPVQKPPMPVGPYTSAPTSYGFPQPPMSVGPYTPAPASYGYPQPPMVQPPMPSYGYPQQMMPGYPQMMPGYGYPQQMMPGYYPQPMMPGYGYPQQMQPPVQASQSSIATTHQIMDLKLRIAALEAGAAVTAVAAVAPAVASERVPTPAPAVASERVPTPAAAVASERVPTPAPAAPASSERVPTPAPAAAERVPTPTSFAAAAAKPPPVKTQEELLLEARPEEKKVPTPEEQLEMLCPYCPGTKPHTFSKCNQYNRCKICNHFGHWGQFCKTKKAHFWDPNYESPMKNPWWTRTAREDMRILRTIYDKDTDEYKICTIAVKVGQLLPAYDQCCAFEECDKEDCRRMFHIKRK